ncbi:aminopeptidase [Aedoeadaptatus urinae]|uniref:aminopeptidase n=1 Tax=Aedoeadaptatus urinae TaxID=1871017 RepID=UPI00097DBA47|nr:aminopeptidase [Peptoniphilus urinae]
MNFNQRLQAYAELLIKTGVSLKDGQDLVIRSPLEGRDLVVACARVAYEVGAADVHVMWSDDDLTLLKYQCAPDEVLNTVPDFEKEKFRHYLERGAAFLSFTGSDPDLLKQIDPKKLQKASGSRSKALRFYSEAMMRDENPWTVAGIATHAWAMKVYPDLEADESVKKLWDAIFDMSRVSENTIADWKKHMETVDGRAKKLTEASYASLHYTNGLGTDLTIALPEGHIWAGGGSHLPDGRYFVANIPTEEVFTMPHRKGVDGIVYASMPLAYNGNVIDGFWLRFKEGKVVDFDAKQGKDVLAHLLETDDGAKHLGEVALVPDDSPISNRNQLFYNTLYDENASCHLALGKAYPTCLKDSGDLSKEELLERGANDSLTHVDFMVGTPDLSITATTIDGKEVPIFVDGNWAK